MPAIMDSMLVAEELRPFARWQISLPFGSYVGRFFLRLVTRLRPTLGNSDVRIEFPSKAPCGLRAYRPRIVRGSAALLWLHGGGSIVGHPRQDDGHCAATAGALGIVVVSPRYRLAPEHPYPAAIEDCYAAWKWLQAEAESLGVDPERVAVGGQSAGGGLAAALAQRIHDAGGVQPVAQWLFCPMLDDRTVQRLDLDMVSHMVWNNRSNRTGWQSYLGCRPGSPEVPVDAVPARRKVLCGLPPAWIGVGDIDIFYDEDREYYERLQYAGVASVFAEVAGAPHAFETWAPDTTLSQNYPSAARAWLGQQMTSGARESSPLSGTEIRAETG